MARCQASAVAVSVAIAMMLQKDKKHLDMRGHYKVDKIIKDAYDIAVKYIVIEEQVGMLEHFSIIGILIRSCSNQVNYSVFKVIFALCYFHPFMPILPKLVVFLLKIKKK